MPNSTTCGPVHRTLGLCGALLLAVLMVLGLKPRTALAVRVTIPFELKDGCGNVPDDYIRRRNGRLTVYIDPAVDPLWANIHIDGVTDVSHLAPFFDLAMETLHTALGIRFTPVTQPNRADLVIRPEDLAAGVLMNTSSRGRTEGRLAAELRANGSPDRTITLNRQAERSRAFILAAIARSDDSNNFRLFRRNSFQLVAYLGALHELLHVIGYAHTNETSSPEVTTLITEVTADQPSLMAPSPAEFFIRYYSMHHTWPTSLDQIQLTDAEVAAFVQVNGSLTSTSGCCVLSHSTHKRGSSRLLVSNAVAIVGQPNQPCRQQLIRIAPPNDDILTPGIVHDNPTWIDMEGSGTKNFCTVWGAQLTCYRNDKGSFQERILTDAVGDPGWSDSRAFVRIKPGLIAYCRLVDTWTHLLCNLYQKDAKGVYRAPSVASVDSGYLDGGWGTSWGAGTATWDSGSSDTRWWVNLSGTEGDLAFCRIATYTAKLLCRRLDPDKLAAGTVVFQSKDVASDIANLGAPGSRSWITWNSRGEKAFCRILPGVGAVGRSSCLPVLPGSTSFGRDVLSTPFELGESPSWRWVNGFTGGLDTGIHPATDFERTPLGSAFCRIMPDDSDHRRVSCVPIPGPALQDVTYDFPSGTDPGWPNPFGFVSLPGLATPAYCSIINPLWKSISCAALDAAAADYNVPPTFKLSTRSRSIPGEDGVLNANQAWLYNPNDGGDTRSALFCRRNGQDLVCTRMTYGPQG